MRQFSISYGFILFCCVIIAGVFVANIFLTTSYVKSQVAAGEAKRLRVENAILTGKYTDLSGKLNEITEIYHDLVEKEIVIRNIFNLPEISSDERMLGVGGPERKIFESLSEPVKQAYSTEGRVDALLRLARFEKEKYNEAYDVLAEKRSILDHTPSILPTRGYRTSGFGMRIDPFTGYKQFHGGVDIANKMGTPIFATADGVVEFVGNVGDLGKLIKINHGYGYKTRYGHLSQIKVNRGQKVRRGDLIGLMGSSGYSTGPHLHYEIIKNGQKVNPLEYILNS